MKRIGWSTMAVITALLMASCGPGEPDQPKQPASQDPSSVQAGAADPAGQASEPTAPEKSDSAEEPGEVNGSEVVDALGKALRSSLTADVKDKAPPFAPQGPGQK
jgi:hypothetical protein